MVAVLALGARVLAVVGWLAALGEPGLGTLGFSALGLGVFLLSLPATQARRGILWSLSMSLVAVAALFGGALDLETRGAFAAMGVALALSTSQRPRALFAAHALTILNLLLALVILFGHAYSGKNLFGVSAYTSMPLYTAVAFLSFGLALLFARADLGLMHGLTIDGSAGFLRRRLYPMAIGLPLLLGTLTLAGERARFFNGKFGLAIFALVMMTLSNVLIAVTLWSFERADRARRRLAAVLLDEDKRRSIARELHDEVGQHLTAVKLRLEVLAKREASDDVRAAQEAVSDAIRQVSSLSLDLRPAMLDDLGLLPALLWLVERFSKQTGIEIQFSHAGIDRRFARERETAAFRIVQEALSNIGRHAGCPKAEVRVVASDGRIGVTIQDRGAGFFPEERMRNPSSGGLLGMHERAIALGGTFVIDAAPGQGTRVFAELPETSA